MVKALSPEPAGEQFSEYGSVLICTLHATDVEALPFVITGVG
jgi:hypothetical protein